MVLDGACHDLDLPGREPFVQTGVLTDYAPRNKMVRRTALDKPRIVVRRDCQHHLPVDVVMFGQRQAFGNDRLYVIDSVRTVGCRITRNDFPVYVCFEFPPVIPV